MKKQSKLPIRGARGARFWRRVGIHFAMMLLFLLFFGTGSISAIALWLIFAAALVACFFFRRENRQIKREFQLSSEIIEQYPDASASALREAYGKRRRMEIRFESLLYLCLAAETGLWILLLRAAGGHEISIAAGLLLTGALLLVALTLLVLSFVLPIKDSTPTLNAYAADEERRQILTERASRPDHRAQGNLIVLQAEKELHRDEIDRLIQEKVVVEKPSAGTKGLYVFAILFMVVLPNLMLLVTLPLIASELGYLSLLSLGVAVPCDIGFAFFLRQRKETKRTEMRQNRLLTGRYELRMDRTLSFLRNENEAYVTEVCFDRVGTVKVQGKELQKTLLETRPQSAQLLMDGNEILAVLFPGKRFAAGMESETDCRSEASLPAEAQKTEQSTGSLERINLYDLPAELAAYAQRPALRIEDGVVLTDEQMEEEVLRRIASMDPAERKSLIDEIVRDYEKDKLLAKKTISTWTPAEHLEWEQSMSSYLDKVRGMGYELGGLESELMTELKKTRSEIATMKKNPYRKGFLIVLGIAFVLGVGGNVLAAVIAKATWKDMTILHVIASTLSGLLAMSSAGALMSVLRFRKLQKAYRKAETWEKLINSEVYKKLCTQTLDQLKLNRTGKNGQ